VDGRLEYSALAQTTTLGFPSARAPAPEAGAPPNFVLGDPVAWHHRGAPWWVQPCEDARWAPILDLLRGSWPRQYDFFHLAPGILFFSTLMLD